MSNKKYVIQQKTKDNMIVFLKERKKNRNSDKKKGFWTENINEAFQIVNYSVAQELLKNYRYNNAKILPIEP